MYKQCPFCELWFDTDLDGQVCVTWLREADKSQEMLELEPKPPEMSTPLTEKLPFVAP